MSVRTHSNKWETCITFTVQHSISGRTVVNSLIHHKNVFNFHGIQSMCDYRYIQYLVVLERTPGGGYLRSPQKTKQPKHDD